MKNNIIYSRGGGTCLAEGKHAGVVPGTFKLAARISPQSSELSPQKQPPNDVAQVTLVCRRHLSPQVGSGRERAGKRSRCHRGLLPSWGLSRELKEQKQMCASCCQHTHQLRDFWLGLTGSVGGSRPGLRLRREVRSGRKRSSKR